MALDFPDSVVEFEEEVDYIHLLVHGESGAGKTPFASTASNGLFIAADKGTQSASNWGSKMKLWKAPTWVEFNKALLFCKKVARADGGFEEQFGPDPWLTIDSGTMMQTLMLRNILRVETKASPEKRDIDIPQIQDHQKWQNWLKRTITEILDLPVNVCMTALPMPIETYDYEEDQTEEVVLPQFLGGKGAIAWTIAGQFGAGGRVVLKKSEGKKGKFQRIYWEKNGSYWGRDRYDVLAPYTDNITLDKIAARVRDGKKD